MGKTYMRDVPDNMCAGSYGSPYSTHGLAQMHIPHSKR
jgi:hypothetical protein